MDITIASGTLRKRVTLMSPSAGQSPTSGAPLPPTSFATVWAEIRPMSGSELYRASQFVDEANVSIVIRWIPGVHANMTVEYGVRTFQILAVLNEDERNVKLTLLTKEINP